jgi:hypothetical protein
VPVESHQFSDISAGNAIIRVACHEDSSLRRDAQIGCIYVCEALMGSTTWVRHQKLEALKTLDDEVKIMNRAYLYRPFDRADAYIGETPMTGLSRPDEFIVDLSSPMSDRIGETPMTRPC